MWNVIHFIGLGFQIVAGLLGALSLYWIRVRNNHVEIALVLLRKVKITGLIAIVFFSIGAILIIWYEAHLL